MTDQIRINQGDLPWLPVDSEAVEVLRYHNAPTAGILRQDEQLYLFQAIVDLADGTGLWAYNPVTEQQMRALCTSNTDAGDELAFHMWMNARGAVALVANDRVVAAEPVDASGPGERPAFPDAVERLIKKVKGTDESPAHVDQLHELICA